MNLAYIRKAELSRKIRKGNRIECSGKQFL